MSFFSICIFKYFFLLFQDDFAYKLDLTRNLDKLEMTLFEAFDIYYASNKLSKLHINAKITRKDVENAIAMLATKNVILGDKEINLYSK